MKDLLIILLLIGAAIVIYELIIRQAFWSLPHRQLEREMEATLMPRGQNSVCVIPRVDWEQARQILADADLGNNHLKKEVRPIFLESRGDDSRNPVTWPDDNGYYYFVVIFTTGRSGINEPYIVHSVTGEYSKT